MNLSTWADSWQIRTTENYQKNMFELVSIVINDLEFVHYQTFICTVYGLDQGIIHIRVLVEFFKSVITEEIGPIFLTCIWIPKLHQKLISNVLVIALSSTPWKNDCPAKETSILRRNWSNCGVATQSRWVRPLQQCGRCSLLSQTRIQQKLCVQRSGSLIIC